MPGRLNLDDEKIIKSYVSGLTAAKIADDFGVSKFTILKRLKENNIQRRPCRSVRQIYFDDNAFENYTPSSCYWAGFIAADGCVNDKYNTISIELAIKDETHLLKFCNFINREERLLYRERVQQSGNKTKSCQIKMGSTQIVSCLNDKFNITARKTFTLQPPLKIPNHLVRHYIRGYFDGDGSIGCYKDGNLRVSITSGSYDLLLWIKEFATTSINTSGSLYKIKSKAYELKYSGNIQTPKLMSWMYENEASDIFLERKHNKYIQFLEDT